MNHNLRRPSMKYNKWQYIYFSLAFIYCVYVLLLRGEFGMFWFMAVSTAIIHILSKNNYIEILSRLLLYMFIAWGIIWGIKGASFYYWNFVSGQSLEHSNLLLFIINSTLFLLIIIFSIFVSGPHNKLRVKDLITNTRKELKEKKLYNIVYVVIFFIFLIITFSSGLLGLTGNPEIKENKTPLSNCFSMEKDGVVSYFRILGDDEDYKIKPQKDSYYPPLLEDGCFIIYTDPSTETLTGNRTEDQNQEKYGAEIVCPCNF